MKPGDKDKVLSVIILAPIKISTNFTGFLNNRLFLSEENTILPFILPDVLFWVDFPRGSF